MDKQEVEKCASAEDGSNLNRNRSFKSKQLVRSQAIRESTSPPRTVSPSVRKDAACEASSKNVNKVNVKVTAVERTGSDSSHDSDAFSYNDRKDRRKPVEIQITQGTWDESPAYEHRGRTKRWLSDSSRDSTRDLLSNNPRVACVCGACAACPQCRGRRRRHICTIKQDSGICPDECSECSDPEPNGINSDRKAVSLDVDEQFYCRCPERRDKPKSMLSRTDSDDKSEPTGPELVAFIRETLNKSGKDRMTLLKVEKELHSLVNDTGRCIVKFPVMTSYGRMLVHRCAALFQLSHHLDHSNKNCVIVSKSGTSGGRIPCTNFKAWCVANFPPPSPQRQPPETIDGANAKSILKRDTHSLDEPSSAASAMNRSKSLEQREREYERVRRRIFSTDNCNQDESQWPWLNTGPVKLLAPEPGRNKLLKVQSLENSAPPQNWRGRGGAVSKSHSFGGYGEPQPATRALSRQGDLASSSWRLSPSSSGYKTLSLRSTDSVTPSPTGGGTPEPANCPATSAGLNPCSGPVVWAVTDMACVPPGALVIHPQTGRPLTNADGSVYHFDPSNPPILYDPGEYEEVEQPKIIDQNNEVRRGRLEKQHSFIDHEAECQQAAQYYEYELHDTQENPTEKEQSKQTTPTKTHYDPPQTEFVQKSEPTNQNAEVQEVANQTHEPTNREVKAGNYQDTVYYGPYAGYNEQIQSPTQMAQYIQPDLSMGMIPQAKVTPILQDPNIRQMTLANVVYPHNVPPGYQYVPNPNACRVDPVQQQLVRYQPVLQQQIEEQKVATPPITANDNTFRIDSSYPYAPVDYTAAFGGCVDAALQNQPQPQRSYSVPYNPAEIPGMAAAIPPVYPLGNVIQPQLIQYPVQYQDAVQWTPVQTQAMCPVVYPQHYAHYNIVYPQVVTQPYPMCQPIYPVLDNRRKRNSLPSSTRVTPIITTPEEKPYEKFDRQNSDIAAKINQIKEGMMQREGLMMNRRRDDWKRNSGNGILGSYPVNSFNARLAGTTETVQLTSAARAIVNSIRHLQAKTTTYQERRYDYSSSYARNYDRPDYRRRYDDRGDSNTDRHHKDSYDKGNNQDKVTERSNTQDKVTERSNTRYTDRNSNNSDKNIANSNNSGRNSNTSFKSYQEKNYSHGNEENSYEDCNTDKTSLSNTIKEQSSLESQAKSVQDIKNSQDAQEKTFQSSQDRTVKVNVLDSQSNQDRTQNTVQDINIQSTQNRTMQDMHQSSVQERYIQANVQDRSIQSNVNVNVQNNGMDIYNQNNVQDRNIQSNVQDRNIQSNAQDRNIQSNVQDINIQTNIQDRNIQSNVQDRNIQSNVQDRNIQANIQDRNIQSNVQDRSSQSNVQDRTYDRSNYHDRYNGQDARNHQDNRNQDNRYQGDRPWQDRKYAPRNQGMAPSQYQFRTPYLFRQVAPAAWCRRSPAPVHPGLNQTRRTYPDNRNGRRY